MFCLIYRLFSLAVGLDNQRESAVSITTTPRVRPVIESPQNDVSANTNRSAPIIKKVLVSVTVT